MRFNDRIFQTKIRWKDSWYSDTEPTPGNYLNLSMCAVTTAATITLWPLKKIMRENHPMSKAQQNIFRRASNFVPLQ